MPGARIPDVAPQPPTELVAEGVAADLIQLRWAPSDRAELYRVQRVDEASDAVLGSDDVKDGATVFGAKVEQPLTRACYRVVAVRGDHLASRSRREAVRDLADGRLPPPTNVQAVEAPGGFTPSPGPTTTRTSTPCSSTARRSARRARRESRTSRCPLPAGRHCITVVARRGQTLSSPPSDPPACVEPTAPPSAAATRRPAGRAGGAAEAPGGPGGRRRRDGNSGRRRCRWRRGRGWRRRGNRQPDRRAGLPPPVGSDRSWP